jgi:hypothetical protein
VFEPVTHYLLLGLTARLERHQWLARAHVEGDDGRLGLADGPVHFDDGS